MMTWKSVLTSKVYPLNNNNNRVKHNNIPAATLFSIHFALFSHMLFKTLTWVSVYGSEPRVMFFIWDVLIENQGPFRASFMSVLCWQCRPHDLQTIMNQFSGVCSTFKLATNLTKTRVRHTPNPGCFYIESNTFV